MSCRAKRAFAQRVAAKLPEMMAGGLPLRDDQPTADPAMHRPRLDDGEFARMQVRLREGVACWKQPARCSRVRLDLDRVRRHSDAVAGVGGRRTSASFRMDPVLRGSKRHEGPPRVLRLEALTIRIAPQVGRMCRVGRATRGG